MSQALEAKGIDEITHLLETWYYEDTKYRYIKVRVLPFATLSPPTIERESGIHLLITWFLPEEDYKLKEVITSEAFITHLSADIGRTRRELIRFFGFRESMEPLYDECVKRSQVTDRKVQNEELVFIRSALLTTMPPIPVFVRIENDLREYPLHKALAMWSEPKNGLYLSHLFLCVLITQLLCMEELHGKYKESH